MPDRAIKVGEVRHVGGWMGLQFGYCKVTEVSESRVYFEDTSTGASESMLHREWRRRMPAKGTYRDPSLFTPLTDALVEIAMISGEDWSGYAPDRTGTEKDVRQNPQFRRDLLEKPEMLVQAIQQMVDDYEERE